MAVRYSGELKITINWQDRYDWYWANISDRGKHLKQLSIRSPPTLRRAVDSPPAYDEAAAAAISFAGLHDQAAWDERGVWIGRSEAERWPISAKEHRESLDAREIEADVLEEKGELDRANRLRREARVEKRLTLHYDLSPLEAKRLIRRWRAPLNISSSIDEWAIDDMAAKLVSWGLK
jgi:hypothetical protein